MNIAREVAALKRMTPAALRARYLEIHGEPARSGNKDYLWKRIIWRMQSMAQGDLSERARRRAAELANDADLRVRRPLHRPEPVPNAPSPPTPTVSDPDQLMPGMQLVRQYKGRTIEVTVAKDGFAYEGKVYKSLTAVAKAVTGGHWSGNLFFGRNDKGNHE